MPPKFYSYGRLRARFSAAKRRLLGKAGMEKARTSKSPRGRHGFFRIGSLVLAAAIVPSTVLSLRARAAEEIHKAVQNNKPTTELVDRAVRDRLFSDMPRSQLYPSLAELALLEANDSALPKQLHIAPRVFDFMQNSGKKPYWSGQKPLLALAKGGGTKMELLTATGSMYLGLESGLLAHELGHAIETSMQPGMFRDVSVVITPYKGGKTLQERTERFLSLQQRDPAKANQILLAGDAAGFDSMQRYAWMMEEIAKANTPNARFYASAALFGKLNFPVYAGMHYLDIMKDPATGKLMEGDLAALSRQMGINKEQMLAVAATDLLVNYNDIKFLAETIWRGSAPAAYRDKRWDAYAGPMVMEAGAKRAGGVGIRFTYVIK